jgi:L-seryl-tRNA(Ser) seleniumtransferase
MNLKDLPSVDRLLTTNPNLIQLFGRRLVLLAYRTVLDDLRNSDQNLKNTPSLQDISTLAEEKLCQWFDPSLKTVINATGVVLHTNLGRAPLSKATISAMTASAAGYSNLEFDLNTGKRGSRTVHTEDSLVQLTGAEAGFVVNNCAAAVLLALSALAKGKKVVIPRSQLVEIGGGFRVPDVMKQSGAKLVEVGTTNKVRISDFAECFEDTANSVRILLLRAHRSNFKIIGFTEEPTLKEMCDLAHQHGTILIDDLGSGALIDSSKYGIEHEPTVQESLAAGADLVLFSGDKLVGGPQAGILVGRKELIDKLKKHPLARAVRADKTCLAGTSATLMHYLLDEEEKEVPIWKMISYDLGSLRMRTMEMREKVGQGEVIQGFSAVGGGALPGETIPTWLLTFKLPRPQQKLGRLRSNDPPVIARIEDDKLVFDLRTVFDEDDNQLITAIQKLF